MRVRTRPMTRAARHLSARVSEFCRCKLREAALADGGMTWTEARIALLTKLWSEGLSASKLAAKLGGDVSRNAVISKAHRLGIPHGTAKVPSTPPPSKPTRPPDAPTAAEPPTPQAPAPAPLTVDQPPAAQPVGTIPEQKVTACLSKKVTIMELREAMCRIPLGDPTTPEFRFCDAQASTGLPYCAYHARIAYVPAAERKRLRA